MTTADCQTARPAAWQEDVASRLQRLLVAPLDPGLTAKQGHWNLRGPGFRSTYLHLDDIADSLREQADVGRSGP